MMRLHLHFFSFYRNALEYCAKKVSQYSGDIRRGLHICRRALELRGNGKTTVNVRF